MMKSRTFEGFTLIELLIVISIIGLLSTLLMANMFGVREKGRDTQRKSDIAQIQRALEMYKDNINPIRYPATATYEANLEGGSNPVMATVPHDPRCPNGVCTGSWVDYRYSLGASDNLTYTITACLENKSDTAITVCPTPTGDPCLVAGGACFKRNEP